MKNYSKYTLKNGSGSTTSKSTQSLFMDESSEDLENYLNTPLPDESVTGDQIAYFDQDLECSTMNTLSKNIKGKFQKDSRKNKFFKSKSLDEKALIHSNEVPTEVINEAMKKIFKEVPYQSNLKSSPKVLKTYSNKHKNKSFLVESFGLPDEPLVSIGSSRSKEQNSIDLDVKTDKDSYDLSFLFGSWLHPHEEVSTGTIDVSLEFRSKSASAYKNTFLQTASLETEVKECFNFEDDVLMQHVKPSNGKTMEERCPIVSLKTLNFDDDELFEANNLPPTKNRKKLLLERWERFNTNLKDKRSPNGVTANSHSNFPKVIVQNKRSKKNTRSNSSPASCINNFSANTGDIEAAEINNKSSEKFEKNSSLNLDIVSPRRSTRRIVGSLPLNANKEHVSSNLKSPIDKTRTKKVSPVKGQIEGLKKDASIENSPTATSRDVRQSLRSSNSSIKLAKNTASVSQKLLMENDGDTPTTSKCNRQKDMSVLENNNTPKRRSHRLQLLSDQSDNTIEPKSCIETEILTIGENGPKDKKFKDSNQDSTVILKENHHSKIAKIELSTNSKIARLNTSKEEEPTIENSNSPSQTCSKDVEISLEIQCKNNEGTICDSGLTSTNNTDVICDITNEKKDNQEPIKKKKGKPLKNSKPNYNTQATKLNEIEKPINHIHENKSENIKEVKSEEKLSRTSEKTENYCTVDDPNFAGDLKKRMRNILENAITDNSTQKFTKINEKPSENRKISKGEESELKANERISEENTVSKRESLKRKRGRPRKTPTKINKKETKYCEDNIETQNWEKLDGNSEIFEEKECANMESEITSDVLNVRGEKTNSETKELVLAKIDENVKESVVDIFEDKEISEEIIEPFEMEKKIIVEEKATFEQFTKTEEATDDKMDQKKSDTSEIETVKVQAFEKNVVDSEVDQKKIEKVDETYVSENLDIVEGKDSKTSLEYSDFGYDTSRRMSFRKILEKVMEASRLELAEFEASRSQRCKSVPHEQFRCISETNDVRLKSLSADSKLKFLKDRGNYNNSEISRVKKRLDYNLDPKTDVHSSSRKRTKSLSVHKDCEKNNSEIVKSTTIKPAPSEIENTIDVSECKITGQNIDIKVENSLNREVEHFFSGSNSQFHERKRSKSFSGTVEIEKFAIRSASSMARKNKKKLRRNKGGEDLTQRSTSKAARKVYEFKIGDSVWAKLGNYPYWPGLIVEDPESSEFKKFRLLRSTPYYHVRFFGDNGKRAWTTHCIPYEGPDDLNVFMEQCKEIPKADLVVKASQREKWNKAVQEVETLKNTPVDEKLGFFDGILPSKEKAEELEKVEFKRARSRSISFVTQNDLNQFKLKPASQKEKIPMKVSSIVSCINYVAENFSKSSPEFKNDNGSVEKSPTDKKQEDVVKVVDESSPELKRTTRKRSVPMKDISVLSAIDEVVKKYCSENVQSATADSKKKNSSHLEKEKKCRSESKDDEIGLELLDIPSPTELKSPIFGKSPNLNLPIESTAMSTPVSSKKPATVSPKRTRSKSSLPLQKRRLSKEFKLDEELKDTEVPKTVTEPSFSPRRMKLKRRTIAICPTNAESSETDGATLNECITRLPEYKKNLFRGVPKERICQICEKPGEVVKCRGPCNGDFHVRCVENCWKNTEKLTFKKTEDENWQTDEIIVPDNDQVLISTVVSRKKFSDSVILSPINKKIPLMEQIDRKMKELMSQVESRISVEYNESSSEEIEILDKAKGKSSMKRKGGHKHVTADDASDPNLSDTDSSNPKSDYNPVNVEDGVYKCAYCLSTLIPPCFVCNSVVSKKGNVMRQRCSLQKCGRYYHLECLNDWHQTQWSFILHDKRKTEAFDSFVCPRHSCHICASENSGFSTGRCPNDKLVKCLRCPATYHNSYHCIPAGTDILSYTQIVCPRHVEGNKACNTLNTIWCFVCSEGGNLICCETCPTSVHAECLPVNLLEDDTYICEDCESGRFPLYDEVVWVKCGTFRWWPAIILFPSEVPDNVESKPHSKGEFVVKFFGTYNYFWVGRGRAFLYQEGDTGSMNNTKNKIDEAFSRALREAANAYSFKKGLRAKKQKEVNNGLKPPPYVRIKVNRPVGNVKVFEGNLSNTTPCDCDPKDKSPCGPDSNCLNRILLTECTPDICPAGQKCQNQSFEKREYPNVVPYRTTGRGWGLKTLEPIKKGRFVIEYVGELIDDEEYQRRITRMHQQKDENYYFLTIDKDRMLDAGPKGNVARFMNHSCQPNCETQKWTVNGDTRVGLFTIKDIPVDSELTFNYNLECVGTEKKICRCGAPNCSGFIGVKPEDQKPTKKNSSVKTVVPEKQDVVVNEDDCFVCGKKGNVGECSNKTCFRVYHLECVQLDSWPNNKWNCPSHNCNICSKRTSRICVLCNNSYCPFHSDGNIRYDDSLGYLCSEHDQAKKKSRRQNPTLGNMETTNDLLTSKNNESLRSERYKKRTGSFNSGNPKKKIKLEKE